MEQGVSLYIDPSGAQTGGRVVKREFQEIGLAAISAQQRIEQFQVANDQAAKSAQASAQVMIAQLDNLRAKYNPLFAVIQRYKAAQDEIRQAHRLGALSATEMTSALSRERQAALSNIQAIKGYSAALTSHTAAVTASSRATGLAMAQRTNLIYQLNDVGVSLASGMNPLMVLIQQGSQIATIYSGQQGGVGKALKETASMAVSAATRFWPLAAAGAAVYGAYRLISSYSVEARHKVSDLTKAMAEQAMSAGQLKAAVSEYEGIRTNLIDAQGISGALNGLIGLQGNYSEAIANTGTVQSTTSNSIVNDLRLEYEAKRSLLEIEQQLQQAKLATLQSELAVKQENLRSDIAKNVNTRPDLVGQGYEDPRVGRLTQIPGEVGGVEALQNYLKTNENAREVKRLNAEITLAEVAAGRLDKALETSFGGAAVKQGITELANLTTQAGTAMNTTAQSAGGLGVSLGGIGNSVQASLGGVSTALYDVKGGVVGVHTELNSTQSALQTAQNGVVNVTQRMAQARLQTLSAYQQTTQQITLMKKELANVQAVLANASSLNPSEIFGKIVPAGAAAALSDAVAQINAVTTSLGNGETSALQAHQAIEQVRASLLALGANPDALNQLINALMNGAAQALTLKGNIDQVSRSIAGIPNRIISIGVQQYTVPASGGGTKGVNVLGGNPADMSVSQYSINGKTHTVYGGNGNYSSSGSGGLIDPYDKAMMNITLGYGGARAAGGPTEAGKTYLIGENGPELMTMSGAGNVTNANSTASLLSGGRDTLSLIEDHLYNAVQELRIHTNYFETYESDLTGMYACLKDIKAGIEALSTSMRSSYSGSSYGGSSYGGSTKKSGGYGRGSLTNGYTDTGPDYSSIYTGPGITYTNGTGLIGYATYNITPSILGEQHNPGLKPGPNGFATGGQIMPGEDQKVEFFKRNKERVLIVDDSKVSDQRSGGGSGSGGGERPIIINPVFHNAQLNDPRSRQQAMDDLRRTVHSALKANS